ncbi:Sec61beta family-domain-containing protein [Colletotrichum acutatum]|uniref:Sec61beta family-domain-containing protein n=1 Tax=Glomerella acutata TaxID=27357 RepID=A0AAD8XQV2_GLOAC|nr:Sec61beta family-domain-containing protein [Colletotrichum acutatum]KAK1731938.1 Sec61beta family-domain-containing protein [Colletotrichum acutatum]
MAELGQLGHFCHLVLLRRHCSNNAVEEPNERYLSVEGLGAQWSFWEPLARYAEQPPIKSSPRPSSPVNGAGAAASGASVARPSSPTPPGGPRTAIRRRAAADQKEKIANARPNSTRAAGAGGSSSTMLRLYTDESPGLKVDPVVVLVLSLVFIFSVVALHIIAKLTRKFSS